MKRKLFLLITLIVAGIFVLVGCNGSTSGGGFDDNFVDNAIPLIDDDEVRLLAPQLATIRDDEEIAVITTNYGVMYARFFPEHAPLAVESFITHSRDGFYDGVTFHRVLEDFMLQGGCPLGTGTGGTTIWGHDINVEPSDNLVHLRGALSMANADDPQRGISGTTGSQFFIVQTSRLQTSLSTTRLRNQYNEFLADAYLEHGGTQYLDGRHTVFGQIFRGMDVVDRIANVPVYVPAGHRPPASRPVNPVIIESIQIVLYSDIN